MQVLGSLRSVLWDAAQLPGAASCDFSSWVVRGSPDQGEGCSAAGRRLRCVHSSKWKRSGPGHEQRTLPEPGQASGQRLTDHRHWSCPHHSQPWVAHSAPSSGRSLREHSWLLWAVGHSGLRVKSQGTLHGQKHLNILITEVIGAQETTFLMWFFLYQTLKKY